MTRSYVRDRTRSSVCDMTRSYVRDLMSSHVGPLNWCVHMWDLWIQKPQCPYAQFCQCLLVWFLCDCETVAMLRVCVCDRARTLWMKFANESLCRVSVAVSRHCRVVSTIYAHTYIHKYTYAHTYIYIHTHMHDPIYVYPHFMTTPSLHYTSASSMNWENPIIPAKQK